MDTEIHNYDIGTFKTIKFDNNCIYFGQVAYAAQNTVYLNKEDAQECDLEQLNMVRHGVGVEIQLNDKDECISKYEGRWDNDVKQKFAKILYPDQSFYKGNIKDNKFQGYGTYQWNNGIRYDGEWKNDRFQGGGKMTNPNSNFLQGIFQNNYLNIQENFYLNPFLPLDDMNDFMKNKNFIHKIKERNYNKKLFQFQKIYKIDELKEFFEKSQQNKRIPLILSSKQLLMGKDQIYETIKEMRETELNEFDFRKVENIYIKAYLDDDLSAFMNDIKEKLATSLVKGQIFAINIDDSDIKYDNPDISKFYSNTCFPIEFWNLQKFYSFDVFNKILTNTEFKKTEQINASFFPIIWSKFKIDQNISQNRILEHFEKRFQCILPIKKLDLALLCENENIDQEQQLQ